MRTESFGEGKLSKFDQIIFLIRTKKLKKYLTSGTILEVGCGYNAPLLDWVSKNINNVNCIGVDLSVNNSLNRVNFNLIKGDLNQMLPIGTATADVVVSAAVLEHLDNPEKNLKEIYRVLKPGGRLILTTPTKAAKPVLEFLAFRLKIINKNEIIDHKRYFDGFELSNLLISSGFEKNNIDYSTFTFGFNNFIKCKK